MNFKVLICAALILAAPCPIMSQEAILVGYDGHAGLQGAIWATKDLGLFEKHGLSGELILIPGSARGMAAEWLADKIPLHQALGSISTSSIVGLLLFAILGFLLYRTGLRKH